MVFNGDLVFLVIVFETKHQNTRFKMLLSFMFLYFTTKEQLCKQIYAFHQISSNQYCYEYFGRTISSFAIVILSGIINK